MRLKSAILGCAAAALALTAAPVVAKAAAPQADFAALLLGTWGLNEVGSTAPPECASTFFSGFDKAGKYWDTDSTGIYTVRGGTLSVRVAGEGGKLGEPVVSRLIRVVSPDELLMANDEGEFGMRRCAEEGRDRR